MSGYEMEFERDVEDEDRMVSSYIWVDNVCDTSERWIAIQEL